jgi:tetratricopeptide (TPR) repeat protein
MLGVSLQALADIQRKQGNPTCAATFFEALDLATANGDAAQQATYAFNLGHAYREIAGLRNLEEAERWYRKSLDLHAPDDRFGRSGCIAQLGQVAYARFKDTRAAKRPAEEVAGYLREAARLYEQALEMMPATAVTERGIIHNQLGIIYDNVGDIDRALRHYQQDIRYCEQASDIYGAGRTRANVAIALRAASRLPDARTYAEAALANFRTFGDRATVDIEKVECLISAIEEAIARKASGA